MKKYTAIGLAVLLCLTLLCGCSGNTEGNSENGVVSDTTSGGVVNDMISDAGDMIEDGTSTAGDMIGDAVSGVEGAVSDTISNGENMVDSATGNND